MNSAGRSFGSSSMVDWRTELMTGCWGVRGECLIDEPLAPLTTWRIGGRADLLVRPLDIEDVHTLFTFIRHHGVPWQVLGGGSNVLVADKGVRGVVIQLTDMDYICQVGAGQLKVGAGCRLNHLVTEVVRQGYAGFEFLAGIPGTVGGAVVGNAGALSQQIGDCVQSALVAEVTAVERWTWAEFGFGYRSSALSEKHALLEVVFKCESNQPELLHQRLKHAQKHRCQAQAVDGANAGSVFKNPPGRQAWRLIDQCGLRGKKVGEAQVAQQHTNFIVNNGAATAEDIIGLMIMVQRTVEEQTGVVLIPEVHVMGDFTMADGSDLTQQLCWGERSDGQN
ncbi:MAG: UDP-N-acetylmuramate dehydrogenase [Thermodesulfobacteriota bacterium]|nr:UDP-N-acetylmuramate dehydrogenase [Thermodesulfobacteriota bacterium]